MHLLISLSSTPALLKLKHSNVKQIIFILYVLFNLYNIQPLIDLSCTSQPVFLVSNFSRRTIKLNKAISGFVGKCLVLLNNLSGICSLMTFLLIHYKFSPSFIFWSNSCRYFHFPWKHFRHSWFPILHVFEDIKKKQCILSPTFELLHFTVYFLMKLFLLQLLLKSQLYIWVNSSSFSL